MARSLAVSSVLRHTWAALSTRAETAGNSTSAHCQPRATKSKLASAKKTAMLADPADNTLQKHVSFGLRKPDKATNIPVELNLPMSIYACLWWLKLQIWGSQSPANLANVFAAARSTSKRNMPSNLSKFKTTVISDWPAIDSIVLRIAQNGLATWISKEWQALKSLGETTVGNVKHYTKYRWTGIHMSSSEVLGCKSSKARRATLPHSHLAACYILFLQCNEQLQKSSGIKQALKYRMLK